MKSIKNRLCKIVVATAMILSGCFITQTVEAVDDSSTRSENYFTNNLVVESDGYAKNGAQTPTDQNKGSKPTQITPSDDPKGSNINTNVSNEGMVWTDKKVEKVEGQSGLYKITFEALGFKYRNVNENNDKQNNVWKNPLKENEDREGSELIISETINKNFSLIIEDEYTKTETGYNLTKTDGYANYFNNPDQVLFTYDNDTNKVKLSFDAQNVKMDNTGDGYRYDSNNNDDNGIAFDVEASFYVRVNNDVEAGTYETEDAISSFEPATDNFYYYEWGTSTETLTYGYDGINWNNHIDDMKGINSFQNIVIPTFEHQSTITFSIGVNSQGTNRLNAKKVVQKQGNYVEGTPQKEYDFLYYINVIDEFNQQNMSNVYDWNELGIKEIYFYWFSEVGSGDEKEGYTRVEVLYKNDSWGVYMSNQPLRLNNNGGNIGKGVFDETTITNKEQSEIRSDKDPNGDGIINEKFTNHGQIKLVNISDDDINQKKIAHVYDWDKRIYKIDLYAAHNIDTVVEPIDLVMMLDFSGSMPWFVSKPTGKVYDKNSRELDSFKNSETINKNVDSGTIAKWNYNLYVKDVVDEGNQSEGTQDTYEYKPIVWCENDEYYTGENEHTLEAGWYIVKSRSDGVKVIDAVKGDGDKWKSTIDWKLNNDKIYSRGTGDQTKLEALKTAITAFVSDLKKLSPNSRIAIIPFAGQIITNSNVSSNLTEISVDTIDRLFNSINLHGGTNQKVAMEEAKIILENNNTLNKEYAILFSDGAPSYTTESYGLNWNNCKTAADNLKDECNLLFTAGIFADDALSKGIEEMEEWASDNSCVYIRDTSKDLQEAFKDIFGRITIQITDVQVIDYIDERFIITNENGEQLTDGSKFDGGTVRYSEEKKQWYIEWNHVNLSYAENVENGWHKTIYVTAKDVYIGGNDIPTNGSGSGINIDNFHKEFDQPKVNVKVDFVVGNADETIFLGEAPLGNAKDKLFGVIKNSKGTPLTMDPNGDTLDMNDFDFNWYTQVDEEMNNVVKESKIDNSDISSTRPSSKEVYYLQVKLNSSPQATDKSTSNTDGKSNTEENYLLATNDMDGTNKVGDGLNSQGNSIDMYAKDSSKYGVYIVDVVSGSITINKNITGQMADPETQGDSIFTFLIEGETVSGKTIYEYKVLRFNTNDAQSFTLSNLEKGKYKITELKSIRYDLSDLSTDNSNCPNYSDKDNKKVEFYIGCKDNSNNPSTDINATKGEATYTNIVVNDENYGDTDFVKNKFSVSNDGKVTITPSHGTENQPSSGE